MKFIFAIVLFALISCNNPQKKETETLSMPGAYNMLSQTVNDGKRDTTYNTTKQLKIYTDDYMMYANINPADSISSFGIGTYSIDSGKVKENVFYSANDSIANSTPSTFTLLIEKTPKGYIQVIPEIVSGQQKFKLTEEYESAGTATKSPLDGAWKEIKLFYIKGKDTVINKTVQYKTYHDGHFMWGHTFEDSAHKTHTGIGFGTFEMNGSNKLKETVAATTYHQIRGKTVDLDVEMNGKDEFKQTIISEDGGKQVEVYQRIKK